MQQAQKEIDQKQGGIKAATAWTQQMTQQLMNAVSSQMPEISNSSGSKSSSKTDNKSKFAYIF